MNRNKYIFLTFVLISSTLIMTYIFSTSSWIVFIKPSLEDVTNDGEYYNPSTQSFLRGHHWLESIKEVNIKLNRQHSGSIYLRSDNEKHLSLHNIPFELMVPRLHYTLENSPDEFEAFNLMMGEYSRNSLSIPTGKKGDQITHFRSNLKESVPWKLTGDYQFQPNKYFRPLRIGITNNCLKPGLWEFNATDRAGEIYHSWFSMPENLYVDIVSKTNHLSREFTKNALSWKEKEILLRLERLRTIKKSFGNMKIAIIDGPVGFSTQDSRRKLHKKYVQITSKDGQVSPKMRQELLENPVSMSDFISPGKYSLSKQKHFDLSFLKQPIIAEIFSVHPKTSYKMNDNIEPAHAKAIHLEINIHLKERCIIIGNLPLPLLVQQEDFVINGFGVGIFSASGLPERRDLLIKKGPHPSYAYLTNATKKYVINSHKYGIEQIFIRTHPFAEKPFWEITISSFERIVDIVKYHIEIPEELQKVTKTITEKYITPIYFSYRDDNLR